MKEKKKGKICKPSKKEFEIGRRLAKRFNERFNTDIYK